MPREVITACNALPVSMCRSRSWSDHEIDIVKGDACFQSYLCHIPRSTVELGLAGKLDALDGLGVVPRPATSSADLSGLWRIIFPDKLSFYLDLPQAFDKRGAAALPRGAAGPGAPNRAPRRARSRPPRSLVAAIEGGNAARRAMKRLAGARIRARGGLFPADESYQVVRAGNLMPLRKSARRSSIAS